MHAEGAVFIKKKRIYLFFKRIFSFTAAAIGIVVLSPLFLFLCAWILIDDGRPVFFKQKRVGKDKKLFMIYKFRTMKNDTPHDMPTHLLADPDQYITRAGRFLRKTSLDDLPQLFNILKGDIDVVSVRPALWNQEDLIAERDRYGANDVRPGLTGWAQVHGRDTLTIEEKAALDGYYVQHMGFGIDMKTILLTFTALGGKDVVEGGPGNGEKTGTDGGAAGPENQG